MKMFCVFTMGMGVLFAAEECPIEGYTLFYDDYIADEQAIIASVYPGGGNYEGRPYIRPNYLPLKIVNNSGIQDPIFIAIAGSADKGASYSYVDFRYSPLDQTPGTLVSLVGKSAGTPVPSFQIGASGTTTTVYIPPLDSGRVFFCVGGQLHDLTANGNGQLVTPSVTNPGLECYRQRFDKFEFHYLPYTGNDDIDCNATAVDFFSIPLHIALSTPAPGSASETGFATTGSGKCSDIFNYAMRKLYAGPSPIPQTAALLEAWSHLLTPPEAPLRILSPAQGMAFVAAQAGVTPTNSSRMFDPNYLNNNLAYGGASGDFLSTVWGTGHYGNNTQTLKEKSPQSPFQVYTATNFGGGSGPVDFSPGVNYDSFGPGPITQIFDALQTFNDPGHFAGTQTLFSNSTSFLIFGGENLGAGYAKDKTDGNQISKLFEEAVIAGLIPAQFLVDPLSETYLHDQKYLGNYYKNILGGSYSVPGYDIYSEVLHTAGANNNIPGVSGQLYTFAFDEPLWPEVKINGPFLGQSQTQLTVTIGNLN